MTDYIELVLEEQEDEREDSLSQSFGLPAPTGWEAWGGRGVSPTVATCRLPRQREPTQVQGGEQGDAGENPLGQTFGLTAPSEREPLEIRGERENAPDQPLGRSVPLERELLGAAEGLRGRLRRAEAAAAYRGESAPIEVREEWGGHRGRSVLELDAAFARDARRYDNGFELF